MKAFFLLYPFIKNVQKNFLSHCTRIYYPESRYTMKSGELNLSGYPFKCFFFQFKLRSHRNNQPFLLQKFFLLSPSSNSSKEEAFSYLAHALLVAKCCDASQLHKLHTKEFSSDLSMKQFTSRLKLVFDAWESLRTDRLTPILFTDETSLQRALSLSYLQSSSKSAATLPSDAENSLQDGNSISAVPRSSIPANMASLQRKQVEFSGKGITHSSNSVFPLAVSHIATETDLFEELEKRAHEIFQQKNLIISLNKQLEDSKKNREKPEEASAYYELVKKNESAVVSIEKKFESREKEMQEMFQNAMQERDITIAQLSSSKAKLLQQQNHFVLHIKELERLLENSRRQVPVVEEKLLLNDSHHEKEFLLSNLEEVKQRYTFLSQEYKQKEKREAELTEALSSANSKILLQEAELQKAYFLMSTLKEGLQFVQQFLLQR